MSASESVLDIFIDLLKEYEPIMWGIVYAVVYILVALAETAVLKITKAATKKFSKDATGYSIQFNKGVVDIVLQILKLVVFILAMFHLNDLSKAAMSAENIDKATLLLTNSIYWIIRIAVCLFGIATMKRFITTAKTMIDNAQEREHEEYYKSQYRNRKSRVKESESRAKESNKQGVDNDDKVKSYVHNKSKQTGYINNTSDIDARTLKINLNDIRIFNKNNRV